MRQSQTLVRLTALLVLAIVPGSAWAAGAGELDGPPNYDALVQDLLDNLGRDQAHAQDAAFKLAKMGKLAVSGLTELLANPGQENTVQVTYYAVLALSRIRAKEAATPLLPIIKDSKADAQLRALAVGAYSLSLCDEAVPALEQIAAKDPDRNLRWSAYDQLSTMVGQFKRLEPLFVAALSDADDQIRTLAARQCYLGVYTTGTDKLIALAEKDPVLPVKTQALLALTRLKPKKAVPALVRLAGTDIRSAALTQLLLRLLSELTDASFKDLAAVHTWWEDSGKEQYSNLEKPATPETPAGAAGPAPAQEVSPAQPAPAPAPAHGGSAPSNPGERTIRHPPPSEDK